MNSDRVVVSAFKRFPLKQSLGGVIVSLQKTRFDHLSCLRIFSKIDTVFEILMEELHQSANTTPYSPLSLSDLFQVPYDECGA